MFDGSLPQGALQVSLLPPLLLRIMLPETRIAAPDLLVCSRSVFSSEFCYSNSASVLLWTYGIDDELVLVDESCSLAVSDLSAAPPSLPIIREPSSRPSP